MNTEKTICPVCPTHCRLGEGEIGRCLARRNKNQAITDDNYGQITSFALDPIEKKPLRRFYPGSLILSVGSYGCNLSCPFCQNHEISMVPKERVRAGVLMPEDLVAEAVKQKRAGNIGIAYTYNEPMVGYEYVLDTAKRIREKGMKNVVVTNGCVEPDILNQVLPYIDAFNIDLKSFRKEFYQKIGGDLETVKAFIQTAANSSHVEVTTLIIPGENDSEGEIEEAAAFLSSISPDIPYHISRFFPQHKYGHLQPTQVEIIYRLADVARRKLKYVYTGNC